MHWMRCCPLRLWTVFFKNCIRSFKGMDINFATVHTFIWVYFSKLSRHVEWWLIILTVGSVVPLLWNIHLGAVNDLYILMALSLAMFESWILMLLLLQFCQARILMEISTPGFTATMTNRHRKNALVVLQFLCKLLFWLFFQWFCCA